VGLKIYLLYSTYYTGSSFCLLTGVFFCTTFFFGLALYFFEDILTDFDLKLFYLPVEEANSLERRTLIYKY